MQDLAPEHRIQDKFFTSYPITLQNIQINCYICSSKNYGLNYKVNISNNAWKESRINFHIDQNNQEKTTAAFKDRFGLGLKFSGIARIIYATN